MAHRLRLTILTLAAILFFSPLSFAAELDVQKELSYRVEFGSPTDVQMLLGRGGNPNGVNELGWPLVSIAARRTDGLAVEVVDMLVQAGADINQGGPSRQFPIIIAARNGDEDLANYLLKQGADPTLRDRNGVEPAEIAKYYGHGEVYDILEELAEKRAEEEKKRRSPERMKELQHQLVALSCASQYMKYYFSSGMDKSKFSKKDIDDEMNAIHTQIGATVNDLHQIFRFNAENMQTMQTYGAQSIYRELEDMISPRNRHRLGVGKEGDREQRCNKIADEWMATQEVILDLQKKAKEAEESHSSP